MPIFPKGRSSAEKPESDLESPFFAYPKLRRKAEGKQIESLLLSALLPFYFTVVFLRTIPVVKWKDFFQKPVKHNFFLRLVVLTEHFF